MGVIWQPPWPCTLLKTRLLPPIFGHQIHCGRNWSWRPVDSGLSSPKMKAQLLLSATLFGQSRKACTDFLKLENDTPSSPHFGLPLPPQPSGHMVETSAPMLLWSQLYILNFLPTAEIGGKTTILQTLPISRVQDGQPKSGQYRGPQQNSVLTVFFMCPLSCSGKSIYQRCFEP